VRTGQPNPHLPNITKVQEVQQAQFASQRVPSPIAPHWRERLGADKLGGRGPWQVERKLGTGRIRRRRWNGNEKDECGVGIVLMLATPSSQTIITFPDNCVDTHLEIFHWKRREVHIPKSSFLKRAGGNGASAIVQGAIKRIDAAIPGALAICAWGSVERRRVRLGTTVRRFLSHLLDPNRTMFNLLEILDCRGVGWQLVDSRSQ